MNRKESSRVSIREGVVGHTEIDQESWRPLRQTLSKQGAKGVAASIERLRVLLELRGRDDVEIHLDELVRLEISSTPSSNVQHKMHYERQRQDDADLVDYGRRHNGAIRINDKQYPEDANLYEAALASARTP